MSLINTIRRMEYIFSLCFFIFFLLIDQNFPKKNLDSKIEASSASKYLSSFSSNYWNNSIRWWKKNEKEINEDIKGKININQMMEEKWWRTSGENELRICLYFENISWNDKKRNHEDEDENVPTVNFSDKNVTIVFNSPFPLLDAGRTLKMA